MDIMRIVIAADHNGSALKARLIARLTAQGHDVDDRGADGETVDYPPLCSDIGNRVVDDRADRGIVIGGSGQGEQIACNKIRGIRAGLCHELFTTEISRAHNDANVLVMGAQGISPELAGESTAPRLATPATAGPPPHRPGRLA